MPKITGVRILDNPWDTMTMQKFYQLGNFRCFPVASVNQLLLTRSKRPGGFLHAARLGLCSQHHSPITGNGPAEARQGYHRTFDTTAADISAEASPPRAANHILSNVISCVQAESRDATTTSGESHPAGASEEVADVRPLLEGTSHAAGKASASARHSPRMRRGRSSSARLQKSCFDWLSSSRL